MIIIGNMSGIIPVSPSCEATRGTIAQRQSKRGKNMLVEQAITSELKRTQNRREEKMR